MHNHKDRSLLHRLRELLREILGLHQEPERGSGSLDFSLSISTKPKDLPMLTVNLTTEQQVLVTLSPKTATGKPAKLDGVPTWVLQDGDATIVVASDGLSATLVSEDALGPGLGESHFLVSADADLGQGIDTITDIITLVVTNPKATDLGFTVSAPTSK